MNWLYKLKTNLLKNSIFGWILFVSLIPFLIITYLSISITHEALYEEITANLAFIANEKASKIDQYVEMHKSNASQLAHNPKIIELTLHLVPAAPFYQTQLESKNNEELTNYFKQFLQRNDLTNIFIVSPTNKLIFTTQGSAADFASLLEKPSFIKIVRDSIKTKYPQSSTLLNNQELSQHQFYVATPIFNNERLLAVLILQFNDTDILTILNNNSGLGSSGATLVGTLSGSTLNFLQSDNSKTKFVNFNNQQNHLDFDNAFKEAINGSRGIGEFLDYHGDKILAAWQYLPDMKWGMMVKVDQQEALSSIARFEQTISIIGAVVLILAILMAYTVAKKLQTAENELKNSLENLEKSRQEAADANLAKSAFLANMSHELRTPLNAITGYSEMLIEDAEMLKLEGFVEDLQKINGAGKHLLELINDVLDISKIEAGRMDLYIEKVEITRLLNDVSMLVNPLVEKKQNSFTLSYPENLGEMQTDTTKLRQCLLNLISNASKFTENGKIVLQVERFVELNKEYIRFCCEDTGIGMTDEQISKIFQAFTQADISTTRKFGGTGLGLYLTQKFTKMLDGKIYVKSEPNKGSRFIIEIPRVPVQSQQETLPTSDSKNKNALPNVLIVDDDKKFHNLMEKELGTYFHFLHAYTGEEGLKMAKEHQPDAITLDVIMPGIDGWAVLKNLRQDPDLASIPIIMASMANDKELGYTLGIADFLVKPVKPQLILSKLEQHINAQKIDVLIVEDDTITRKMMVKMVEKAGINVREAENGQFALQMVAEEKPSAILLDLMMPEVDGFSVVKKIRSDKRWKDIPIIIITAKDISTEERARLNDALTIIMKKGDYRRKDLIRSIHTQIEKSLNITKKS